MAWRVSDAVCVGMDVSFDASWKGGVKFTPFKVDNNSAVVEFLRAVLESDVGTRIKHFCCLTEPVAKCKLGSLFLSAKDARAKHAFAPHIGLQAVYAPLASIHFKQRVPAPSTYALKCLVNSLTRKGGGKMFVDKDVVVCSRHFVFLSITEDGMRIVKSDGCRGCASAAAAVGRRTFQVVHF
eukprot:6176300-Pleurochrysis_carterae.AAC.1